MLHNYIRFCHVTSALALLRKGLAGLCFFRTARLRTMFLMLLNKVDRR